MNGLSTVEFLSHLASLNVKLAADGGRLHYTAPAGVMTPDLRNELAGRKKELLSFIKDAALTARIQPPTIARIPRDAELPLSFAQGRLWLLNQLEPGGVAYNIPSRFRFKGNLNLTVFEQSLSEIVRRHEVLRTYYLSENGRPVQKIAPPEPFRISVVDLQALPDTERQKEAERIAFVDAKQPFDLGKAPLMRATLLKLAPEEQILLLNIYHIAFDGWSFGVLIQEMSVLYQAFLKGNPSPLPELPIQYVDFAAWQVEWLQGEVLQGQLDYWKERLSGGLPILELPTDRPRPAVQTSKGSYVAFALSKELTSALKILSQLEGVTLFVTLLAAFKVLLLRYTAQEDIIVGTTIANRNRTDIEKLIGFFVNTLVMRTDLSGNPTFRELLRRAQDTALGAYAHQDLPFEKLVEEVNPKRDLSRSPIFQVMFSLLNTPMLPFELPGLEPSRLEFHNGDAKFDLSVLLEETNQRLAGWVSYNTNLWDEATVVRMVEHFEILLGGIASNPEQRLYELPLLTHRERSQILVDWNDTQVDYPANACIQELFEAQAGRTPNQAALVFGRQTLTYGELNGRANQLAHHLRGRGVGPNVLVGLFVERSLEMLVGLLGILKSGGAYVPMDPGYPKERLGYILADSKAPIVLTKKSLVDALPSFAGQAICLDADWAGIAHESEENLVAQVKPEDLAYVLFTSGSSGRPKGAAIEHRAAVNFLQWAKQVFTPGELAAVLFSTSVCFDLSVFEIFVTLSAGGKIILAPNALHLPTLPAKDEVTLINTVPSAMAELVRMGAVPASVKTVNLAGEALSDTLVEQIYASTQVDKVYNLYGPTETTTYSTYTQVRRGCPVTIGRPIANTQCYILDASRNPVPVGVKGELYLAGSGLARGYYERPELTSGRFVPNPFSEERGGRMYRTGDLCRWLPDGNIQYLGRIDYQIKLRGFRIELGEIENVLHSYPGVREAVVVVREEGEKRLVAYVVLAGEPACTIAELRDFLKQKLPNYMVPAAWAALPALPLTPNGKIDRQALMGPDYVPSEGQSGHDLVHPPTLVEMRLRQIWKEVLGVRNVGMRDSFFDVGGHSLLAVRIIGEINKLFDVSLTVPTFFLNPTIESIARVLEQANDTKLGPKLIPLRPARSEGAIFFLEPSIGMCRLAELLDEGPGLFAVSSLFTRTVLEAAKDNKTARSLRMEDIAAPVAALIKGQQVSGLRVLVGYCFDGNLAFEVAHQLRRDGVPVDMIVMLDSWRTSPRWWRKLKVMTRARLLSGLSWRLRPLWLITTRLAVRVFGSSQSRDTRGPTDGQEDVWPRGHVPREIHDRIGRSARRNYQCRPLEARGVLVLARDGHLARLSVLDRTHGWGGFFNRGLEIVDIPGDHDSLIADTGVPDLSQVIQKCLARLVNH